MKKTGFTLVELMVTLGISSIVTGLIFSFFISNFKVYKSVRNDSELQFQAQYILNFVADKIIDSQSISYAMPDNIKTYSMTTARSADMEYPLEKISFKYGNDSENYIFHIVQGDIRYGNGAKDMNPSVELGKFVDGMFIILFKDGSFQDAKSVIIKIAMKRAGQTYEAYQAVHLRN